MTLIIYRLFISISQNISNYSKQQMASKPSYKTFCFEHKDYIMFFYYNHNHPIMTKNYKFQLGKVRIFTPQNQVYSCHITSNPHLNLSLDWNEEYFAKLFHGLSKFELEGSGDEDDNSKFLLVRDYFQEIEEIFLMRAKLVEQFGFDVTNEFWNVFKNYNMEKIKSIDLFQEQNRDLSGKCDTELIKLIELQNRKQIQKNRLKGQLSALLREKQAKLKQYNQTFTYLIQEKQSEPSMDLSEQKDSISIAGSLFPQSQEFYFGN